ncbi:MAG TPA: radical SAM protein [Thermoguttaceae bacterium]|nr:radical SAM protein [Thermoguttaceae bacterium]
MIQRRLAPSFLPTTGVLELTYRCNHRCLFCSCPWENDAGTFARREELSTDQWRDVLSKLCAMGVANLAFTGGEPLLRDDLTALVRHAASCQTEHVETIDGQLESRFGPPRLYLLSNGRLVDDAILTLCKQENVQLSMSLPGLETFEEHTGHDGADGVLARFARAKALGLETVANITVTRLNLHELDRTISAALLAGAHQILLNRFLPGGRGLRHTDRLSLAREQLVEMLDTAERVLDVAGRFGSLGTEVPKCLVDASRYKRLSVSTRCSAAVGFFVIGPSGHARVCNHSPVQLTHFSELESLKTNDYWRRFTQKQYLPEACGECGERFACDAGCREAAHIATGQVDGLDPLLLPVSAHKKPSRDP